MELNSHVIKHSQPGFSPWYIDIQVYANRYEISRWEDRMRKQLLPVYLVAYILTPENREMELTSVFMQQLEDYIIERIREKGYEQWMQYYIIAGEFNPYKVYWMQFAYKPKLFWMSLVSALIIISHGNTNYILVYPLS
jgi:hypothetical protein